MGEGAHGEVLEFEDVCYKKRKLHWFQWCCGKNCFAWMAGRDARERCSVGVRGVGNVACLRIAYFSLDAV